MTTLSSVGDFCNKFVIAEILVDYMKNRLYKIGVVITVKYIVDEMIALVPLSQIIHEFHTKQP